MKKEIILFLFGILFLQVVLAETTFFEGDLGYRDDYIMGKIEVPVAEVETYSGKGRFIIENKTIACNLISTSLKEHIKEKQNINYSEEDLQVLTAEINKEFKSALSPSQAKSIIENYEDTCETYLPLWTGIAGGRLRNLTTPLVLVIAIILLVFVIIIGYLIIRTLRKRGYGRKIYKKPEKIDNSLNSK